jgi:hypothetical protein
MLAGAIGTAAAAGAPTRARASATRVFTAEQASAGRIAYESSCGLCHQYTLLGRTGEAGELPGVNSLPANMIQTIDRAAGQVPAFVGPKFMARWGGKSTKEYVDRVQNAIGALPPTGTDEQTKLLVTAYLLSR